MATQQEVAIHIDLSSRRVRDLVKGGILPASKVTGGYDLDACRSSYIGYLRGLSSGQVAQDDSDKEDDGNYQAMLEKEKWRKEKRNNDIEEYLVAPVELLTEALAKVGNMMVPILESLPLELKRDYPELTGYQITIVKNAIIRRRNAIADAEIDLDG